MSDEQYLNPEDITEFTEIPDIPVGAFKAKLKGAAGQLSKSDSKIPTVIVDLDIVEGDHVGESLRIWYSLYVKTGQTQQGKPYTFAPGFAELKETFAAVGEPVGKDFKFIHGTEKAAQVLAAKVVSPKLKGKILSVERFDEPQFTGKGKNRKPALDDEGNQKFFRRNKVVGLAGAAADAYADIE